MATPSITSVSPLFACKDVSTPVTITGTNFQTPFVTSVTFGGVPAVSYTVDSNTQITAFTPTGLVNNVVLEVRNGATPSDVGTFEFYFVLVRDVPSAIINATNEYFDPCANYTFFSMPQLLSVPATPGSPFVLTYNPNTGAVGYQAAGGGPLAGAWETAGNNPVAPAIFGTLNSQPISFQANSIEYMQFDVATQRMDIVVDNFHVNSGTLISMEAPNVDIEATAGLSVGSTATPEVVIGNNVNPTHVVSIQAPNVFLDFIPAATTANVVYIDTTPGPNLGKLSYGAAGGGAGWLTTGNSGVIGGKLGTLDAQTWELVAGNIQAIQIRNDTEITLGGVKGLVVALPTVSATVPGDWVQFIGGDIYMTSGSPADPGPVPAGSTKIVSNGVLAGGGYQGVTWTAFGGNLQLDAQAGNATLSSTTGVTNVRGETQLLLEANAGNVDIQAPTAELNLSANAGAINALNLAPLVTAQSIYYNNTTGRLTYGAAAGVAVAVQVFSTAGAYTYTPAVGMKYCEVIVTGGGGSGGGATTNNAAAGGGAGGTAMGIFDAATIGVSQAVNVGAGAAGATNAVGNTGGNTTFGALLTGNGGGGGQATTNQFGGGGGNASGGFYAHFGQQGGWSFEATGSRCPGQGGASYWGADLSPTRAETTDQTGADATVPGCGGGGSVSFGGNPISGVGAPGIVFVREYI